MNAAPESPESPEPNPPAAPEELGPVRHVPMVVATLAFVVLGLCLIGAARTKIRSDAQDAAIREWGPVAAELYATLRDAPEGEPAPRAGSLLPIRIDELERDGRLDFQVFLAMPAEWRPAAKTSPTQVLVLRYRDAELRHYGQGARGGDLIRRRQACALSLYDLARGELIAERELLAPDPLPEGYRDAARLTITPELVLAELRELSR